jgi:hypothetical protein
MPNATVSRDELVARYVKANAIETLILTLAGRKIIRGLWSLDGAPLADLFPTDDTFDLSGQLNRLALEEWSTLWPEDEMPPDYFEAERASDLLAAQMLIALVGNPEFCARAAQRLLEAAGAVPATPAFDDDRTEADDA